MSLSEAQVERYSRQIIMPEIGVAGQQRLLQARVALDGCGALAAVLAPYLAGAGVGRLTVHGPGAATIAQSIAGLAPDTVAEVVERSVARVEADVVVATDLPLADFDRVASLGAPVVAGGLTPRGGWLVVAAARPPCVACVARRAGVGPAPAAPAAPGTTAGVVAGMLSLAVLKLLLGLGGTGEPRWLLFDAAASTVEPQSFVPLPACPVCAA